MKKTMYGIKNSSKEIFCFSISTTEGSKNCNSYSIEIAPCKDPEFQEVWMTEDKEKAKKVIEKTNSWYNACFDYPMYDKVWANDMEIFEINIEYNV